MQKLNFELCPNISLVNFRKNENSKELAKFILAKHLNINSNKIEFLTNKYGKPEICEPKLEKNISFNFSHTDNILVLAISPKEIGIDIELLREVESAEKIAKRFFRPEEFLSLRVIPHAAHSRGSTEISLNFIKLWTQKEAYIKCRGLSIAKNLKDKIDSEKYELETQKIRIKNQDYFISICQEK